MTEIINQQQLENDLKNLQTDLSKNLKSFCPLVDNLTNKFKFEPESFESTKGISFLTMKNMLMIEYLTNLLNMALMKTNGSKIMNSQCVLRLAELRCIIEKTKSIEFKLKYQVDKLLKLAVSSATGEQDPLSFKANTEEFSNMNQDNEDEEDDEDIIRKNDNEDFDNDAKKDGIYRPPRLAPVYNDIDQTPEDKAKKEVERLKRRALNSSMMKDIENQYSGAPEEIRDSYANTIEMESNEIRHRTEYEEDNFVRKPLTKKDMSRMKRLKSGANLNSLTSFDDARLLLDENINAEEFLNTRKEKKKGKAGKKGAKKGGKGKGKKKKIRYT